MIIVSKRRRDLHAQTKNEDNESGAICHDDRNKGAVRLNHCTWVDLNAAIKKMYIMWCLPVC